MTTCLQPYYAQLEGVLPQMDLRDGRCCACLRMCVLAVAGGTWQCCTCTLASLLLPLLSCQPT